MALHKLVLENFHIVNDFLNALDRFLILEDHELFHSDFHAIQVLVQIQLRGQPLDLAFLKVGEPRLTDIVLKEHAVLRLMEYGGALEAGHQLVEKINILHGAVLYTRECE